MRKRCCRLSSWIAFVYTSVPQQDRRVDKKNQRFVLLLAVVDCFDAEKDFRIVLKYDIYPHTAHTAWLLVWREFVKRSHRPKTHI